MKSNEIHVRYAEGDALLQHGCKVFSSLPSRSSGEGRTFENVSSQSSQLSANGSRDVVGKSAWRRICMFFTICCARLDFAISSDRWQLWMKSEISIVWIQNKKKKTSSQWRSRSSRSRLKSSVSVEGHFAQVSSSLILQLTVRRWSEFLSSFRVASSGPWKCCDSLFSFVSSCALQLLSLSLPSLSLL